MTLRVFLVLLVCLAASVIESAFPLVFGLREARADLVLAVVLYLAVHDEWISGSALSFCAGYLADLNSATPSCLYTFLAVLTFVVVRMTTSAFKAERFFEVIVLGFGASLVHSLCAALLFRFVVPGEQERFLLNWGGALWSAVATGLGAVAVFALLRRIDAGFVQGDAGPRAAAGKGF